MTFLESHGKTFRHYRIGTTPQMWDPRRNFSNPNDMKAEEIVDKHGLFLELKKKLKNKRHASNVLKIRAIKSIDPIVWAQLKKQRNFINKLHLDMVYVGVRVIT